MLFKKGKKKMKATNKPLRAFHGKKKIKEKYLARVKAHQEADEIIQKIYWDGQKGCAVGCTLEGKNDNGDLHKRYETELGLPEELAVLEDQLFELMAVEESKRFPQQFLSSISVGADLSVVPLKFKLFVNKTNLKLQQEQAKKFPELKEIYEKVTASIKQVIVLLQNEIKTNKKDEAAGSAARSAAGSAGSAAWSAAESAESAARSATWSAESAAWSAAESAARSAAWSAAESAARSATWFAWSAARSAAESDGSAARSAAGSAAVIKMKNHLLKLLKEAKANGGKKNGNNNRKSSTSN